MYKAATLVAVLGISFVALLIVSNRDTGDLTGYMHATADKTVDELENQLPQEVHDRKLNQDLRRVRQDVIDRKVQLTQSQSRIEQLRQDVAKLEESIERRQRLLADAYPILEQALAEESTRVTFASNEFALDEFQHEVDDLLVMQRREEQQLEAKRIGLERLEKSEREAKLALDEMHQALDATEQEVAVLRSRRQQAEIEAQTLDMVNVGAESDDKQAVSRSLNRLRKNVSQLEAQNEAERELAPVSQRNSANQLSRHWSRMEELKDIHDRVETTDEKPVESGTTSEAAEPTTDQDGPTNEDASADDETNKDAKQE